MSRVLITGGAGAIGSALARRLLADPAYEVRICDRRAAPLWMREGCEIRDGDLRAPAQALAATKGCALVVHLAAYAPQDRLAAAAPYAQIEYESAVHASVVRAAIERGVERLVYVSSADVYERCKRVPTPESALVDCPAPRAPRAFARLVGERICTAAGEQHGLPHAICRPSAVYGSTSAVDGAGEPGVEPLIGELLEAALGEAREHARGERTLTPTHVEDVADGILLALGDEAALNEDFNLAGARELTLTELAHTVFAAAGAGADALAPSFVEEPATASPRSRPSTRKARELLGWRAQVALEDGVAAALEELRERAAIAGAGASATG